MTRHKRRPAGDSGGLRIFAFSLLALCLWLSWVVKPAAAPPPGAPAPSPVDGWDAADSAAPSVATDTLRVRFYDVSQGLAALVDLPGGGHVLVDTGDAPARERCGADCSAAHRHLLADLARDLAGAPIDLLWITHQHSDHIGGARDILAQFHVVAYVDNGRDLAKAEVARTRDAARARGTRIDPVDPTHPWSSAGLAGVAGRARLTAIVPDSWPHDCASDPNECSLALRVELGASSILFTGDAEHGEERALPLDAGVTLLQVGHHGSETSSGEAFLARVAPRYAVISAGHPNVGMNADYCLPRASTLQKLNRALGEGKGRTLLAFDGATSCRRSHGTGWVEVPVSDRLWATERDGDVVLVTHGDGVFAREGGQ